MSYLFTISLVLSSLFCALLLTFQKKNATHYILGTFFLFASINISYILIKYLDDKDFYIPVFTEINLSIPILYAALIYYYARAAILPDFKIQNKYPLIIGGFLFYFLLYCVVVHFIPMGSVFNKMVYGLKPVVNFLFIIQLMRFIRDLEHSGYWKNKNKHFRWWLLWLAFGGLAILAISLIGFVLQHIYPHLQLEYGDYWICSFLSIYFFGLSVISFGNSSVFKGNWMPKPYIEETEITKNSKHAEKELFVKLRSHMETEKSYLDPQLSVAKLAKQLDLPDSKVSRLINDFGEATFFDFVNGYRVEEVKAKIADHQNDHLSLLGIALDSGFNTKASFNRTFKKYEGKTPSQFRKELNSNPEV